MVDIPAAVQPLYTTERTNFRVTFPNGEYTDLVNGAIVSETVKLSEGVCSENVFRFGCAERSTLEFDAVGVDDLSGLTIACFLEVDLSSLSAADLAAVTASPGDGTVVAAASSDLGFAFFRIPWFYGSVSTAQRIQGYSDRRHVVAMTPSPWAWSPAERARLDNWKGARPYATLACSPKDLLFANLGFWWPGSLTSAGYAKSSAATFSTIKSAASSFTKTYTSTGGGHTYVATISGKRYQGRLSLPDGLYSVDMSGWGNTAAAWDFFTGFYTGAGAAPVPAVPQPGTPVDYKSPQTYLQPYVGYDFNNWFPPGTHSGMVGKFNPNYWLPAAGAPCVLLTTDPGQSQFDFFCFMYDLTVSLSVDGTVQQSQTFFPAADLSVTIWQWTDADPFPYDVLIEASATAPFDTDSSVYRCFSDSYSLQELLDAWLDLNGMCLGVTRTGDLRFWAPAAGSFGSASVDSAQMQAGGFWWDEGVPAYVSRILWSYAVEDEEQDMETVIAETPAEWIEDPGSTYDLRGNWILNNLNGVSASDTEDLILDRLVPALQAESSGWRCLTFPAISLKAAAVPWIEPGDLLTVAPDDQTTVKSFAMQQTISGIQYPSQEITANGGLTQEVTDGN